MALSEVTYTYSGTPPQTFAVPFGFLRDSHLVVEVNGSVSGVTFTVAGSNITVVTPALISGNLVTIRRETPVTDAGQVVSFSDPSTLRRTDLESMRKQILYQIQEISDAGTNGLPLDLADSKWDGQGRILKDLAVPTSAQDAATKTYVDTALVTGGVLPTPTVADANKALVVNDLGTGYELGMVAEESYLYRIKSQVSGPSGYNSGWQLPAFSSGFSDNSQRAPLELVKSFNPSGDVSLAGNTFDLTLAAGDWLIEAVGHLRGLTDTGNTNASSGQLAITDSSGGALSTGPTVITGVSVATGSDVAPVALTKPTAFPTTPAVLPVRIRNGWRGNLSARSFRNTTGSTIYVDIATGDDGTGTGAIGAPFKSIWKGVTVAGVKTVKVAPGIYGYANGWGVPTYGTDLTTLNVEKWPIRAGEVIVTSALTITSWSATGTAWEETALDYISHVVDLSVLTQDGAPMRYAEVGSVALCQATPGTFHRTGTGTGATVTVHPLDSGEPGHDILVLRQVQAGYLGYNSTLGIMPDLYVDGMTFIGGDGAFTVSSLLGSADGQLVIRNCKFLSSASNGLFVKAINSSIIENCEAHNNTSDGFHDTNNSAIGTRSVFINCKANGNGTTAVSDTINGFTCHSYCNTVRIGCHAERNVGPNYADTGTAATPATMAYSWMVGCTSGSTDAFSVTGQMCGFQFPDTCTAFLYDCVSTTNPSDLLIGAACVVYTDTCNFTTTTNGGTLTPTTLFSDTSVTKTAQASADCQVFYHVTLGVPTTINLRGRASTSSHAVVADFPSYLKVTRV